MYVVHIKINMFTTETRKKKDEFVYYRNTEKKGYVVHIKTSMFTTEYKKKRCVAHTKTSMFTTEISKIQV